MIESPEVEIARCRWSGPSCDFDLSLLQTCDGDKFIGIEPQSVMSRDDLQAIMTFLRDNPEWRSELPMLWDLRRYSFSHMSFQRTQALSSVLRQFPERRHIKRGYLVQGDVAFGSMRMFQSTMSGFGIVDMELMRVSYSRDELIAWLTASA